MPTANILFLLPHRHQNTNKQYKILGKKENKNNNHKTYIKYAVPVYKYFRERKSSTSYSVL